MALTEDQVQRYGRQILLREVGGRGQRRLLAHPVRVASRNAALDVAAAYLAAGGTPVELPQGPSPSGFFAGAPLASFNPDAAPGPPAYATLHAAGAAEALDAPAVVVGGDGVVFAREGACPACLERAAQALAPAVAPADEVLLGALAALALQRLVLHAPGAQAPVAQVRLVDGALRTPEAPRCAVHAPKG